MSGIQAALAATRFGLGARPGEIAAIGSDPRGWLLAQARRGPDLLPPAPGSAERAAEFLAFREEVQAARRAAMPDNGASAPAARRLARDPLRDAYIADALARTAAAAATAAPFAERWALFWCNVFTVSAAKNAVQTLAGPFEREAVRPNAFGRFGDLLAAAASHPAMLLYLDQQRSAGPGSPGARGGAGLNENLAREAMELHSVGPDAGYTQADVTEFARALTGWSVGGPRDPPELLGRFMFRPSRHEAGPRTVMSRRYPEGGVEQAGAILADLAAHPATAARLSRRIARHFVADDPPAALVARLRDAWLGSGGDLRAVAGALVVAPEAWDPAPRKLKTPNEWLVSAWRAVGAVPADPRRDVLNPLDQLGQRPLSAPQPNGWADEAGPWAAPDAVVRRLAYAAAFADARAPAFAPGRTPVDVADGALGARLGPATRTAVMRAETRADALALFLMSPEFMRR